MSLIKKIQNTAFQNSLWAKGAKIVLGVSGGPDSVCLLDIMAKLAPKYGLKLIVAHVNYGLRGEDSERDEKFVRKLAEEYGLEIEVLAAQPHPPRLGRRGTFSLTKEEGKSSFPSENFLRDIRYEFFERVRKENKFDLIAVAHNSDDQVETYLMRTIRGAGLQGLAAMKFRNEKIIRPLLGTSRKEILKYLDGESRIYRTDKTNLKNSFFRNKVRNKLIPYLEKNFNPKIKKTIFDATVSIAEDQAFLEELASRANGARYLSAKKILKLHPSLQRRILLKKIKKTKGDLKDIEFSHIEEMRKALKSTKGKAQTVVFKGLKMQKKGDRVIISNQ